MVIIIVSNSSKRYYKVINSAKDVSSITSTGNDEEELLSYYSEDELSPVSTKDNHTVVAVPNSGTSSLMSVFKTPCEIIPATKRTMSSSNSCN